MNWLEFILLFVAGCVFFAAVMATLMFSLWTIKHCAREIARTIQEFVAWISDAKTIR